LHSSTHSPGGATSREHNAPYGKILRYEWIVRSLSTILITPTRWKL
jgi:hypothetical protein